MVHSDWSGDHYNTVMVDSGNAVTADLLLDQRQEQVYVLTSSKVRQDLGTKRQENQDNYITKILCPVSL